MADAIPGPLADEGSWESLLTRPTRTIPWAASNASAVLIKGACILVGWAAKETSGAAAATVHLHAGEDANAPLCYPVALASGADDHEAWGEGGIFCPGGIYREAVAGSTTGAVFVKY